MNITELRQHYHTELCQQVIRITTLGERRYPNFADGANKLSSNLAWSIVKQLADVNHVEVDNIEGIKGQTAGDRFEELTKQFVEQSFALLEHLRPGEWHHTTEQTAISQFAQYQHLLQIEAKLKQDKELRATFGGDYIVTPDIVISRRPLADEAINAQGILQEAAAEHARNTILRATNYTPSASILHAVISCKWTIRSDRSQNSRTEALNLIRNRKGHLPHIVAVTAEPFPNRIAALALGTGDLDCIYHFALPELLQATSEIDPDGSGDLVKMMVDGRRLRDISDLPFDLAV